MLLFVKGNKFIKKLDTLIFSNNPFNSEKLTKQPYDYYVYLFSMSFIIYHAFGN